MAHWHHHNDKAGADMEDVVAALTKLLGKGVGPGVRGVAIVPGTPFSACRAVNCKTAGTAVVTWAGDGSTSEYQFVQGNNVISITNVAAGGSASGLLAVY